MSMKKTSIMKKEHKISTFSGEAYSMHKTTSLQSKLDSNIKFKNQLTHLYEEILAGLSWSA